MSLLRLKPTLIIYDGYTNGHTLFLKGRAFKTRFINRATGRTIGGNLLESLLRFVTFEYCNLEIAVTIEGISYRTVTNDEGYFTLDEKLKQPFDGDSIQWIDLDALAIHPDFLSNSCTGRILYVPKKVDTLVISDIDDTIMWSYVTSYFKIKMMYFTFTRSPFQRSPVKDMHKVLNTLSNDGAVFYVSNSSWNIYDFLKRFIKHYDYPDGPTFLRDYGRQLLFRKKKAPTHKMNTLNRIIETFSEQEFILIGDSAEKDIEYYISMYNSFRGRIKQILIHDINHRMNRMKIETLIKVNPNIPIELSRDVKEFLDVKEKESF